MAKRKKTLVVEKIATNGEPRAEESAHIDSKHDEGDDDFKREDGSNSKTNGGEKQNSSRKDQKKKLVSMKQRKCKEEKFKGVQYCVTSRCAPNQLKVFMDGLSEERRNDVRMMGFGGLLELNVTRNRSKDAFELLRRFNPDNRELNVHGRKIPITEKMVNRLLGLPMGPYEIKVKRAEAQNVEMSDRDGDEENVCKIERKRKRKTEVLEEMKSVTDDSEWKAYFLFMAFKYVLCPTSSNYVNKSSTIFRDIVGKVHEMNWCQLVLDRLCDGAKRVRSVLSNREREKKVSVNLKGCTLLLELLYVENVDCGVLRTPVCERQVPRLIEWDDQRISKVYKAVSSLDDPTVKLFESDINSGASMPPSAQTSREMQQREDSLWRAVIEDKLEQINSKVIMNRINGERVREQLETMTRLVNTQAATIETLTNDIRALQEVVHDLVIELEERQVNVNIDEPQSSIEVSSVTDG